ncbi:hypothetical protein QR680_001853 [Steinernema hermaphroditum]|uniref:Mitochondrial import receptor subunit TOM70 n=1 Tax=Steinernema hermaphroditum TaxID=289476 RepID=A0AA39H094_9BILA|nr:hypothetical protein QR680_001853 [Steinernema hermaphroditum]
MQSHTSDSWGTWPRAVAIAGVVGVGGALGYYYYARSTSTKTEKGQDTPINADEWKKQGNSWFREKNYDKALECFQKAIDVIGEDSELKSLCYQNCAAVYDMKEDFNACLEACTNALRINPRYAKALHRRSKCYNKLGAGRESLEDEIAACAVEKKTLSAPHCQQILTSSAVSAVEARRSRNYKVPISPTYIENWAFYSFERDPAVSLMKSASSEGNDRLFAECFQKVKSGDVNELLDLILPETQSEDSPFLLESLLFAARLYFHHGCLEDAHRCLNRCDKLWEDAGEEQRSKWTDHRVSELILRFELAREPSVGKSFLTKAAALDSTNRDMYIAEALHALENNDYESALSAFEKANDESKENYCVSSHIKFIRGLKAFINSDMAGINSTVLEMESYAERIGETYPLIHMFLGRIYSMCNAKDQAVNQFKKAEAFMPKSAELALLRASLELSADQASVEFSKAIEMMESVADMDPNYGPTFAILARLYMQSSQYDKAIEAFDRGLAVIANLQMFFVLYMERTMLAKSLEIAKRLNVPVEDVVTDVMGSSALLS